MRALLCSHCKEEVKREYPFNKTCLYCKKEFKKGDEIKCIVIDELDGYIRFHTHKDCYYEQVEVKCNCLYEKLFKSDVHIHDAEIVGDKK